MADEPDEAEVVFAFSPALAVQGLLDFTKSEHSKIYKSAIREVCKEPFDCEAEASSSSLKTYILTVDSDIGKFNQYVKLLLQSLTARNQKTSDLLINLFKGYGAVSDEVFRAWLMRKQDDHEEGEELTPDDLMIAAKNKYDTMVEKGTWNAPTAEEKIVALEAKFNSTMKSLNKKVSHESSKKKKAAKSGGDKQSSKKKEGDHPKKWKAPKPGDKKVDFQGHMWYWCGKDTGGKCEK
ncbi:hypothetical protein MHU86_2177 [Fragilaria crotonensis]|nr:hypothetical protein MHU86_2177 [Fragilaria crotonensis]